MSDLRCAECYAPAVVIHAGWSLCKQHRFEQQVKEARGADAAIDYEAAAQVVMNVLAWPTHSASELARLVVDAALGRGDDADTDN